LFFLQYEQRVKALEDANKKLHSGPTARKHSEMVSQECQTEVAAGQSSAPVEQAQPYAAADFLFYVHSWLHFNLFFSFCFLILWYSNCSEERFAEVEREKQYYRHMCRQLKRRIRELSQGIPSGGLTAVGKGVGHDHDTDRDLGGVGSPASMPLHAQDVMVA
jgi:hypothetical protein